MDYSLEPEQDHSLLFHVKPYARTRPSGTVEFTIGLQLVQQDRKGNQQSCECNDCKSLGQELVDRIREDYRVLNTFLPDLTVGSYVRLSRTLRGFEFEEDDIDVTVQDCVVE